MRPAVCGTREGRLECFGGRPGLGLHRAVPGEQCRLPPPCSPFLAPPSTEDRPLASGVQGPNLWGVPGIWALPGPQFWGQASPLHVVPCSNGILYQYPDRTDVTPLLSVNMG